MMYTTMKRLLQKPFMTKCLYSPCRHKSSLEPQSIVDILRLNLPKPAIARPLKPSSLPHNYNRPSSLLLQKQKQQQQQPPPSQIDSKQPTKPNMDRPPRDEEITARFITLVDEKGDLHQKCRPTDVLYTMDRTQYFLVEVDPHAKPFPVCKLFDKKTLFDKEKSKKKKKSASPASVLKEVALGWNVTDHDMEHKLGKAFELLDKGHKVKVNIAHKKNQKWVDEQTQHQLVAKIEAMLKDYKVTKKKFSKNYCSLQFEKTNA